MANFLGSIFCEQPSRFEFIQIEKRKEVIEMKERFLVSMSKEEKEYLDNLAVRMSMTRTGVVRYVINEFRRNEVKKEK